MKFIWQLKKTMVHKNYSLRFFIRPPGGPQRPANRGSTYPRVHTFWVEGLFRFASNLACRYLRQLFRTFLFPNRGTPGHPGTSICSYYNLTGLYHIGQVSFTPIGVFLLLFHLIFLGCHMSQVMIPVKSLNKINKSYKYAYFYIKIQDKIL